MAKKAIKGQVKLSEAVLSEDGQALSNKDYADAARVIQAYLVQIGYKIGEDYKTAFANLKNSPKYRKQFALLNKEFEEKVQKAGDNSAKVEALKQQYAERKRAIMLDIKKYLRWLGSVDKETKDKEQHYNLSIHALTEADLKPALDMLADVPNLAMSEVYTTVDWKTLKSGKLRKDSLYSVDIDTSTVDIDTEEWFAFIKKYMLPGQWKAYFLDRGRKDEPYGDAKLAKLLGKIRSGEIAPPSGSEDEDDIEDVEYDALIGKLWRKYEQECKAAGTEASMDELGALEDTYTHIKDKAKLKAKLEPEVSLYDEPWAVRARLVHALLSKYKEDGAANGEEPTTDQVAKYKKDVLDPKTDQELTAMLDAADEAAITDDTNKGDDKKSSRYPKDDFKWDDDDE